MDVNTLSRVSLYNVRSWQEQDESGTWWWHAQLVVGGEVHRSRVSRQRAISYALRDATDQLHDYDPTTPVDAPAYCERDPKCVWPQGHGGDTHCHTVSAAELTRRRNDRGGL